MTELSRVGKDRWSVFRVALALLSVAIAAASVLSRFSAFELVCGTGCRTAQDVWYSPFFLVCLAAGSVAAFYSQFWTEMETRRRIAGALGAAGVLAFGAMLSTGHFCSLCLAAQAVWVGLALEASGWLGIRIAALLITCLGLEAAYEVWGLTGRRMQGPVAFQFRNHETAAKSPPYSLVVFTDPLCPFCRQDERSRVGKPSPMPITYRWKIVHGAEATRLAAGLESALATDRAKGLKLFSDVYAAPAPPNEGKFISLGIADGFAPDQLKAWIETPDASSLAAIANDGILADRIGIEVVPTLCAVDSAGETPGTNVRPIRRQDLDSYAAMTSQDFSSLRAYVH